MALFVVCNNRQGILCKGARGAGGLRKDELAYQQALAKQNRGNPLELALGRRAQQMRAVAKTQTQQKPQVETHCYCYSAKSKMQQQQQEYNA
jgi:hypothetical protein